MKIGYLPRVFGLCTLIAHGITAHSLARTHADSKTLALATQINSLQTSSTNRDFLAVKVFNNIWPDTKSIWDKYCKSTDCIDNQDSNCKGMVEKSFAYFLTEKPFAASLFAQDCIEKSDTACKTIVQEAFPKLLEKNLEHAFSFMTSYLKYHKIDEQLKNPVAQHLSPHSQSNWPSIYHDGSLSIITKIYIALLEIDPIIANNFLSACEKNNFVCEPFLELFYGVTKTSDETMLALGV